MNLATFLYLKFKVYVLKFFLSADKLYFKYTLSIKLIIKAIKKCIYTKS